MGLDSPGGGYRSCAWPVARSMLHVFRGCRCYLVSICAMLDLVRHQQKLGNGAIMCQSHSILVPPSHLSPTAHQTHHDSIVSEIMSITTISFQPGRRTLPKSNTQARHMLGIFMHSTLIVLRPLINRRSSNVNPPAHPCVDDLLSLIDQAHIQQQLRCSTHSRV